MHKIKLGVITAFLLSLATASHATGGGFYFGAQAGQTNVHQPSRTVQTGTIPATQYVSPDNTGFGGRFFMGANINEYSAIEGGYTYYAPATYKPTVTSLCGTPSIQESALDLVGKGMFPFGTSGFGVYGKAGVAYINTNSSGSLTSSTVNPCSSGSSTAGVRPTAGVGVSYDITPSWVTDLSWTRVFSNSTNIKNADLIALGISYHFVDHYTGQFLSG